MIPELHDKRIVLALAFFAFVIGWIGVLSPYMFMNADRQDMIQHYTNLPIPPHIVFFAIAMIISSTCAFVPKVGTTQNVPTLAFLLMLASIISLIASFWLYDYALEASGYNRYIGISF